MNYKLNGLLFDSARQLGVTRTEFWTLQGIANFANDQTGACFPSTAQISNATLLNERTIRIAIQSLEKKGLLSTKQKPGGKRYFTFAEEKIEALSKTAPLSKTAGGQKVTGGQKLTPVPRQKLTGEGGRNLPGTPAETYPRTENITEKVTENINREVVGSSAEAVAPSADQPKDSLFDNQEEPVKKSATKKKTTASQKIPFDYNSIPDAWEKYCKEVRPDLNVVALFNKFSAYWVIGKGAGTRRSEKGWNQTWFNFVNREKKTYKAEVVEIDLNCPIENIVAIYHKELPQLPKVVVLSDEIKRDTCRFWLFLQTFPEFKDQTSGLDVARAYFKYVGLCDFLVGNIPTKDGKPAWRANYAWLIKPENAINVINGKYTREP